MGWGPGTTPLDIVVARWLGAKPSGKALGSQPQHRGYPGWEKLRATFRNSSHKSPLALLCAAVGYIHPPRHCGPFFVLGGPLSSWQITSCSFHGVNPGRASRWWLLACNFSVSPVREEAYGHLCSHLRHYLFSSSFLGRRVVMVMNFSQKSLSVAAFWENVA